MKRYIRSSRATDYTDHYTLRKDGVKFSVYTKYVDDPDNFQCQISEIHPYDDADYAFVYKNSPADATVYKNGKPYGHIEVREWDDEAVEEYRGNTDKFVRDIINYLCTELRKFNRDVEPRMIHN